MAARKQYDSIAIDQIESDETDDEDVFFNDPRRNLLKDFSKTSCNETNLNVGEEHMKVYLRVRPLSEDEVNRQENQGCVEVEDDNHVVTRAPKDSHTFKNCIHGLGKTTHKFTFSKIFNEATSQKDLFDQTMLGLVKDFISGQNCLVFTYGVTSSGKTYTIQGQPSDAGVLPRALDVLFNSIYGKQVEGMKLKPKMFTDVVRLSSVEEEAEKKFKEKTLKMSNDDEPDVMSLLGDDASDVTVNTTSCSESSNLSYATSNRQKASLDPEDLLNEIEHRVREETAVSVEDQGSIKFSIWVSFAEIYNEQIFDLLVPIPKKKNVRRPVLKLSDDKKGSPYIKGLREIHVASADEAYKLLTIGKQNLSTACTKLNHQSSRSHCIFNIKILRVMDVEDPNVARVSMLTLCDLAGSERTSKTLGNGERLKEAGNINTSLMTLGRCIEMLRYNQHHKEKSKIIPFRDSKLTRLFQNFFSGRGKAAMIVNVNQCASMFDETLHVFKFSAIAKQVVVAQKPDPPPRPRYITLPVPPPVESVRAPSIVWATPGQLCTAEKVPLPEDEDDNLEETDEVAELTHIIEEMEKEIRGLRREMRHQEGHIREEVCQEMKKQFVAIEENCRERIRWTEEQAEETMEKRIKILTNAIYGDQMKPTKKSNKSKRMEDNDDEWVSSILLHQEKVKVEEKEEEITRLQQQIKTLVQKDTKEATKDDETSVVEEMSHQLTELRQTITEKDEEIEKLNEMLEEAGETFAEKETELSRLHRLISTHEEKIKEQGKSISDLEEALRESQLALNTADRRLTKQEEDATTQNEAKAKLQEELTTAKGCVGFLEQTVKQKEEEVRVWKSRCQRAEEDSIKQEQALINGYKAEISTLKQQMLELKSNSSITKAHGDSSPRKKGPDEDKDTFYQNLSVQLKELQSELDKNSAVTLELQQALETARAVSEDLEQQLGQEKEAHAETRVQLSQLSQENEELQQLKVKVTQLENSFEDREQNLASKVEQNLKAEGLIAELEEELKSLKCAEYPDQLAQLQKEVETLQESLVGKDEQLDAITEKVEELQTVNTGLRDMINQTTADLQAKEYKLAELTAKVKVNEDLKQSALSPSSPLSSLQRRMREIRHESEATKNELTTTVKAHQKLEEELNTLKKTNKEEQEKIQQLNSHIKDLEFQLDESQIDRSHIIEDQKMSEEKADQLQAKIEELEKCVEDLNTQLAKITSEKEQIATKDKSDKQMETQNTEELKEELEQVRQELAAKSQLIEDSSEELQKVKDELKQAAKKGSKGSKKVIERLEGQCEELGQKVKDKESEIERLRAELSAIQSSADTGVVVKSHQIDSLQGELKSMRTEMSAMEKKIADRDHAIKDLNDLFEQNQKELDEKDFTLRTLRKEKDKGFSESDRVASEKMKELEEELESKAQKISALETVEEKVKQFEDETVSLKQKLCELENVRDEKENLENELNGKSQKLLDLEKVEEKNELLENELASLRGKLSDLDNVTKEKEQLQHKLEDKSQRLSELKTVEEKTVQLENELTSLRQNLCELETVKDKNEIAVSELKSLREQLCELQTVKTKNEQIEKELEDHKQVLSDLEGIKEKLVQLQEEVVGREKTISELKTAREKDEDELKVQREEIEKLLERLESTESEIKNLMCEKCELEKKAETLDENLHDKDHQLIELKKVLTDLQDKTKMSSDETNTELSKVKMELAETKSALHMTQTLHQRAKKELMEKTKHLQDMEEKSKVKSDEEVNKRTQLEEEIASVNGKLVDLETLKQDLESKNQSLDNDLVSTLARVTDLTTQIADRDTQVKDLEAKIQEQSEQHKVQVQEEEEKVSALVKACEEKSSVIDSQAAKIKDLAGNQNKSDELGLEVSEKAKKIEELTNTINQLETKLQNSEAVLKTCSPKKDRQDMTRQLEDLQNALDREKVKSEEYHKLLEEMRVKACLSPGSESNSVRRLRKDKIDADNSLLEAKCKIASLERRLADSTLQISPRKYNNDESQKLKLELQECHQKIETLEGQVRLQDRIFSSPRKRESLQRSSVVTSPTVHRELNRSQEREQTLRRQLQQASTNLQELGQKVSDLEDQLSHKVKAIQDAEDTIQALKNPGSRSGRPSTVAEVCRLEAELKQRWGQIQELQSDLIRRDEKLATKSQALKDFKISMERERDDFEAALRDAKANESLIEMLKNAITEQEETMEKQDSYLQRKEEEIRNLSQELEKYTEKYRQVLETSGDSGRKMMELTRENARQVTEHSQQLKEQDEKVCKLNQTLQEQETTIRKLTEDKEKLGVVLKENNRELKDLEKLLSESRTETESLREKLSSKNENKSEAMEKAEEEAALLQVKIREKEHVVRESQRALRRMEEDLNKAQQQVKQTETELVKVKQTLEEKEDKLKTWRTERDNLVAGLEGIMKKQQKEIYDLKEQVRAGQSSRHLEDSLVSPSKSRHHPEETNLPPARPPAPVRSSFRSQQHDDQESSHLKSSHQGHYQAESSSGRSNHSKRHHDDQTLSPVRSSHSKRHHSDQILSPTRSSHRAHRQGSVALSPVNVKEEVPSTDSSGSDDRLKSPPPERETTHRSHRHSARKASINQCPLTKTPNPETTRGHRSSSRPSRKRRSVSESALELPAKKRENFDATFASEESSISDHVQIDATPPVAAKNLRKSRKKHGNTESEGKENTGPSSSRRTRRGTKGTEEPGLGRIGSIVSAIKNSSLTRSAKKLLDDISESPTKPTQEPSVVPKTPSTPDSHYVEVEDQSTQMSGGRKEEEQQRAKRSRKRHKLYNENLHISEPLEGGIFVPNTPTNDVHGIVLRKLRTRKH